MGNSPQDLRNRMWIWIAALILIAVACGCIGLAVGGLAGYLIGRGAGVPTPPGPTSGTPWLGVDNCWQFYYYFGHETLRLGSSAGDKRYHRLAVISGRKASCPCPPIACWDHLGRSASPRRYPCALCPSVLR